MKMIDRVCRIPAMKIIERICVLFIILRNILICESAVKQQRLALANVPGQ